MGTHPAGRGAVGALAWKTADLIGGPAGVITVFLGGAAGAGAIYLASRRSPVNPSNVNDDPAHTTERLREPVAA